MLAACGQFHTVCLDKLGGVWVCGCNENGQLGLEKCVNPVDTQQLESLPKIVDVSCGTSHTVCCDVDGRVYSFGLNIHGQLGVDSDQLNPPLINQIPKFTSKIISVSCGGSHTICIDSVSTCWSFGKNTSGQLGLGHVQNQNHPVRIPDLSQVIFVDCGMEFTVCVKKYGDVVSFGNNSYGQLGLGDRVGRENPTIIPGLGGIKSVSCGNHYTLFLHNNGDVYRTTSYTRTVNNTQKVGDIIKIPDIPPMAIIHSGIAFSILVDSDGNVWTLGNIVHDNLVAQYFVNDELDFFTPKELEEVKEVERISKGYSAHCILSSFSNVWAIGDNTWGQLGLSTFYSFKHPMGLEGNMYMVSSSFRTRQKSARSAK